MGFVVGPLMGGLLSDLSMQMPFIGSAIAAMIAFVWILAGFEETFVKTVKKKIDFSRLVTVFAEAYHNRQIRMLSIIFLLMQLGVSFYLPITLIILTTQFNYTPFQLGLFNGYLGIGFALGLILFLPKMLKRYRIEKIVAICLLLTFFSLLLSSVLLHEWALWVFALPCSITLQTAFSGMFTSYSNAADETSQGWVMGISVAVMAIAWAIGGFCTQLSLTIGPHTLIFIGAILLAVSTIGMRLYCKIYTEQQPS
jgi:predicted MFS family arabinose efflux permease